MLNAVKKQTPVFIKKPIRKSIKICKYTYRKFALKNALKKSGSFKIIVGAAETNQPEWYSTNEKWLDITNNKHWRSMFQDRQCLSHVVAEHVFEHLTHAGAEEALTQIFKYLRPNGRVRIAVPDGYNLDPVYLKHVGIAGIGDDAADHKQLLNTDILTNLLKGAGFKANLIEGYNADGELTQQPYDVNDGFIMRSRQHAKDEEKWSFPDAQTSLIMDGIKVI